MSMWTRRGFIVGAGYTLLATPAIPQTRSKGGSRKFERINAQVDSAINYMLRTIPASSVLESRAYAMLVMPLITKVGFGLGGSYGEGALLLGGVPREYYSATQATFGLQAGAQQYSYVLFFMTPEALKSFRYSTGFQLGADIEIVVINEGHSLSVDTATRLPSVMGLVFGQAGLLLGMSIEGTKYTRIG